MIDFICNVHQRDKYDEHWIPRALYGDNLGGEGPSIPAADHYAAARQAVAIALDAGLLDTDRAIGVLVQDPADYAPRGFLVPLVLTIGEAERLDGNATDKLAGRTDVYDGWTAQGAARVAAE